MHALALEALLKLARAGMTRLYYRAQPGAADRIFDVLDLELDMTKGAPAAAAIQRQFDLQAGLIRHFGYATLASGFPGESVQSVPDTTHAGCERIRAYTLSEAEDLQNRINFLLGHRQRVRISATEMDEALAVAPLLAALPRGIPGPRPEPRLALMRLIRHLQPGLQRVRKA